MGPEARAVATAHFTQPATAAWIAHARHWVTAFAQEHGMAGDGCIDLALAVSEAVTRAVRHADPDDPGEVAVDVATDGVCLTVRVADDGSGSPDPHAPLGLGLPLVALVAERVEVGPNRDGRGTVVLMELAMEAAPEGRPAERSPST